MDEKYENVDDDDNDNDSTTSSTSSSSPSSSSSLSSPIETFKRLYNKNLIENKASTSTAIDLTVDLISPLTPYSELLYFILHTDFEAIRLKQGLVTTSSSSSSSSFGGGLAGLAPHVANTGTTRISLELDLARTWRMNQVGGGAGGGGGGARPI